MSVLFLQTEEAIRYLEMCIEKLGNKDQAIHNYLLSLYIERDDDRSLLRYLQMQGQVSGWKQIFILWWYSPVQQPYLLHNKEMV